MSFHQNKIFLAIGPLTTEKIRIERSGKSRNLDFRNHEKNRFPDHFHSFLEDGVVTFHSFSSPGAQQTTISTDCNEPNSKNNIQLILYLSKIVWDKTIGIPLIRVEFMRELLKNFFWMLRVWTAEDWWQCVFYFFKYFFWVLRIFSRRNEQNFRKF